MSLQILFIGPINSYAKNNTTYQRYTALLNLGYTINYIDTSPNYKSLFINFSYKLINKLFTYGIPIKLPDIHNLNNQILTEIRKIKYNIIYLEKELHLENETFITLKKISPKTIIVGFSPDDMYVRHNQSQNFLENLLYYDYFITTKSFNVNELFKLGLKNVLFINNGYDPLISSNLKGIFSNNINYESDVTFIGSYEKYRALSLLHLAENGINVNVYGNGWKSFKKSNPNLNIHFKPIFGYNFAHVCFTSKINLCFLRKINRDLQTTRSIEIPGCGGFMIAERTIEHEFLFKDNFEAVFFNSNKDLLSKCNYFLMNDSLRKKIAQNGLNKCLSNGYSYTDRLREPFNLIIKNHFN